MTSAQTKLLQAIRVALTTHPERPLMDLLCEVIPPELDLELVSDAELTQYLGELVPETV